jgi:hypothetical protein
MVQDPETRKGYTESEMRVKWPLTYAYLRQFEKQLRARSGFRKYFDPGDAFYSMYNVGDHTLAAHRVVWPDIAGAFWSGVLTSRALESPVVPDHRVMVIACASLAATHYVCALLNSSPCGLLVPSFALGVSFAPHVLQRLRIPVFDAKNALHTKLARLSEQAHAAAAHDDLKRLARIEAQVDKAAAELWGITPDELKTIQEALRSRSRREPEGPESETQPK